MSKILWMKLRKKSKAPAPITKAPENTVIIYTRSVAEAQRIYQRWFGERFIRQNRHKARIIDGHLCLSWEIHSRRWETYSKDEGGPIIDRKQFPVKDFWCRCGFYPIKIGKGFFNKRLFEKLVPNSIRFITSLSEEK